MSGIADRIAKGREVAAADTPRQALNVALERFKPQLQRALPAHMTIDRFISVVMGAVSKNPSIAECKPASILQAVGQAARMGLEIDISGHGFLVAYKGVCTFVPGWQGVVDLINRSGRGVVRTGAVYQDDFFEWELGLEPFLRHKNTGVETAENLIFTYAIGQIRGEGGWTPPPIIEVWSADKIRHHLEEYNKVGARHYALSSGNNWVMYARKIPLLQVAKYMPKSAEISRAIEAANRADTGEAMTIDAEMNFTDEPGAGAPPPASTGGAPTPESFEALRTRIDASANRDAADLILDGARHLPAAQLKELAGLADKKHPRA